MIHERRPALSPTKRELRARIERAHGTTGDSIRPRPPSSVAPMSFGQQRLWLLDRIEAASAAYNVPTAVRVRGALDPEALRAALTALVERHEVLRTTFGLRDGAPVQLIAPPAPLPLRLVDLRAVADADRESACRRIVEAELRRPFDLERGPLVRAKLVRLDDELYVFTLVRHHIVNDAWSNDIYRRELDALYRGFRAGAPAALEPLPIQYADFACWQRERMRGSLLEADLAYWRERLAGAPDALDLPTDRPRPAVQRFRGAIERRELDPELARALDDFARRQRVTPFMLLFAAFAALLARLCGRDDVVVGTPIANRDREELHGLIGFFVNTLPLRVQLDPEAPFAALLARVREIALGAYEHQELPFEKLVDELQPQRSLSHAPIANVFFVTAQSDGPPLALEGCTIAPYEIERVSAKFDLMLQVLRGPGSLRCAFEYSTDLFERSTVVRMLGQLEALLTGIAADPQCPVGRLPLMSDDERRAVVLAGCGPAAEPPSHPTLDALLADALRRTPGAVALVAGSASLTYAELSARVELLAQRLRRRGARPGRRVGIALERSLDAVVAVLAVLATGAAYVPLDPAYPTERLARMLTGIELLVTRRRLREQLPRTDARCCCLDELEALDERTPPPAVAPQPHDVAYVIYTSGSTGVPKGVAMPHRALVNLIRWQLERSPDPRARTLQFASLSFDVSFQEIVATLAGGGTLVLVDEPTRLDPLALLRLVVDAQVARIFVPFVVLERLVETADAADIEPTSLREVVTAGEQLRVTPAMRRFFERLPDCVLDNQYGPTEAHVVSAYRLTGPAAAWSELPPIGRPLPGVRLHVLDARRQPVPPGVHGELYIGGLALADGYVGRPDLTAERFVSDPFDARPDARLYRTGDAARLRADGELECLGRLDRQVKVRGFRVELGELEAALRRCTGVRDAAAALVGSGSAARLAAFVIPDGAAPEPCALRAALARSLPEYMLPAEIRAVDAFPLSPNGKLDLAALAALAPPVPPASARPALANPLHEQLLGIWETLLGRSGLGIDDDFFASGGNSLAAVVLADTIARVFGRRIPVATLFEHSTVAGLARALLAESAPETGTRLVPLRATGARTPLYFVHGDLSGGGYYCRALARELAAEQPFTAIVPHGVDGDLVPATIEAVASENVAALRRVQPAGPYRLGGFCNGGLVAYEMACRLERAGETVEKLILIDTIGRNSSLVPLARAVHAWGWMLRRDPSWSRSVVGALASRLRVLWFARRDGPGAFAALVRRELGELLPRGVRGSGAPMDDDLLVRWEKLGARYVPRPFAGRVTLLWPEEKRSRADELTAHWRRLVPEVETHEVPGGHLTCITRYVEATAAVLERCLAC